jgi:two-component system cell cycle sensor histidine kinase/response regulator CckA
MGLSDAIDGRLRHSATITILLVDDEDAVRGVCRRCLEETGFRVLEAENGLEALLAASEHRSGVDLLITDLVMPRIGGIELGQAFQTIWPGVKVLYVSGSPSEQARLPAGCAFLKKPYDLAALTNAVSTALSRHGEG